MLGISSATIEIRRRNTFSIGLMIALSSWALIFFTLVWGYVVFRMRAASWLSVYLTSSTQWLAVFNTFAIAASSWCLSKALKKDVLRFDDPRSETWAWSAFTLGIIFLIGQFYLWQMLLGSGLHWKTSIAGGMFFLMTGFHAVHILGGLIAILIFCLRFKQWQGTLTGLGIKYFWDFLLVVWLILFVLIFIIQ